MRKINRIVVIKRVLVANRIQLETDWGGYNTYGYKYRSM